MSEIEDLVKRLGDVISIGEGGYESYNTGTKGVLGERIGHSFVHPPTGTVTSKTINQILATNVLSGRDPNRMFATGKYQTIIPTLTAAKAKLGLSGDERYGAELQERVFREFLLPKREKLAKFIFDGVGTVDDAQYAAAKEWASIGVPLGRADQNGITSNGYRSYYEKPGTNSASRVTTQELRELLIEIQNSH